MARTSSTTQPGLPQFVGYRRMVADGVVELHDGALLRSFEVRGPDCEFQEHDVLAQIADHNGRELGRLGGGWMIESNSFRAPVVLPPAEHQCPDPTSALVFHERAQRYAQAGVHYETRHVLTLTYCPPGIIRQQFSDYFFTGKSRSRKQSRRDLLTLFHADTDELTDALRHWLTIQPLGARALVHFLRVCVTGIDQPAGLPANGDLLNYVCGGVPVAPRLGRTGALYTRVVGVKGWPDGTEPQMLAGVFSFPFPVRMSHRFIPMSEVVAIREFGKTYKDWIQINAYNPKRVLLTLFKNIFGEPDKQAVRLSQYAEDQADSVDRAIHGVESGIRYGYYTMTVVLHNADEQTVHEHALEVVAHMNRLGFSAAIETTHVADALGGSWPGHGSRNVRRPRPDIRHFAHLWPTARTWRGAEKHPSPYYPPNSGPLLITNTTGSTPYFLNLHTGSLANAMIIGPSESGKTFLINAIAMAQRQYSGSQVNIVDRDYGSIMPTLACGGEFFDLDAMRFMPLAFIDEEEERRWAVGFMELLARLRNFPLTPIAQADIARAIVALSSAPPAHRTITNYLGQLQTHERGLKEALSFYTFRNGGGMLDGDVVEGQDNAWLSYDMEKLLGRGKEISTPVLAHIFHRMGRKMDGRPTLTFIEEGWMVAQDALMAEYIEEGSATQRKKNDALILVLHSPGALAAFPRRDILLSNIATMVFLPNLKANDPALRPHYEAVGLNSRQIHKIAEEMMPRRDYMCVQGKECRVFQLQSGPLEHALLSVNGRDYKARALVLRAQYGEEWLPVWLKEQGHADLAERWRAWGVLRDAA